MDCNNNFSFISGETGQSFTATVNGNYAVIVTQNGCTDTSACATVSNAGIIEFNAATLQVYPNPAAQHFNVISSEIISRIIITDVSGKVIYTAEINNKKAVVDVSAITNGIYLLQVINNDRSVSNQRIVVGK